MGIFGYVEALLIIPSILYLLYLISRRGKTRSEPTNWPVVGMLLVVLQYMHRGHDYITVVLYLANRLIFAGRDTTSTCLTWLFWLIVQNPSDERKILEEIETELQIKEDRKWSFFSSQESDKLIYLHGALCESLRLYPPVALEHKAPTKQDILPSCHYLHENTKLIFSFYSVGRMESVWGKDCFEFKPERWISPTGGLKHEPSYKFPAVNSGPRTCLGKEMALVQMKMVAATIIYHYKVRLVEGHPVSPRVSIILQATHGVRARLSRRHA